MTQDELIVNDPEFICPICESNEYRKLFFVSTESGSVPVVMLTETSKNINKKPIIFCCNKCSLIFHNPKNMSKINRTCYVQSDDFIVISDNIKNMWLDKTKYNISGSDVIRYSQHMCYIIDNNNRDCINKII